MKRLVVLPFLFLLAHCGNQKIANYSEGSVPVDSTIVGADLEPMISPYRESMEEKMDVVIGKATVGLEKGQGESPLGNFAAEAAYYAGFKYGERTKDVGGGHAMKYSFALLNNGGLRSTINKGEITVGNMFELMPFDNTLVLVKLSPEQVKSCARYLFERKGQPVYNASFKLSSNEESITIGGEPYNFDQDVIIITSDYLASGGDKMNFFKDPIRKWDTGQFLRDVFIAYVKEQHELGAYEVTGKFQFIKE